MAKFGTDLLAHTTTQGSKSRIRLDDELRNVLARYQVQRDDPKKVGAEKKTTQWIQRVCYGRSRADCDSLCRGQLLVQQRDDYIYRLGLPGRIQLCL